MQPHPLRIALLGTLSLIPATQAAPLLPGKKLGIDYGSTPTTNWNNFTANGSKAAGTVVHLDGSVSDGVAMIVANGQFFNNDGTNNWVGLQSNATSIAPNLKAPPEFVDSVTTDIAGNFSLGDGTPFKLTITGLNPYLTYQGHAVSAASGAPVDTLTIIGAATFGPSAVARASAVSSGLYHKFESVTPTSGGQLVFDTFDSSAGTNPILNGILIEAIAPTADGLLDGDGDTMANWWETAYQFDPASPADGGSADADGDGFSNVAEFEAGSDPRSNISTPPAEWAVDGDGNWGTAGNWNPSGVPGGIDRGARFKSSTLVTAASANIALNVPVTLGLLEVTGDKPFTFGNGNTITFSASVDAARLTTSATTGESIVFSGGVVLASPLEVSAPGLSSIAFDGPLTQSGGSHALNKEGAGDLVLAGDASAYDGDVAINGGRLILSRSGSFTFSNIISGSGALVIDGGGTLTMTDANTYTGGTLVTGGSTLAIDNITPLGTGALSLNDGTLRATASISASGRAVNIGAMGATVNVTDPAAIATTGGSTASSGSVLKTGSGTWQITGGNAGTLGPITVAQGIYDLARNDSFGNHGTSQQDLIVQAGAKVTNGTGGTGFNSLRSVTLEGGNLAVTNSLSAVSGAFQAYHIKQMLAATGTTPSTITDEVNGANGSINIGGTADVGGGAGADLVVEVEDVTASAAADLTISAKLKNSASGGFAALHTGIVKEGDGLLVLTRINNYTGNTTVNAGTLSLQQASLADIADVHIGTGAVLHLDFAGTDTIDQITLGGEGVDPGEYGAVGSAEPIIGTPFITGTGTLTVTTTSIVEDPFADWIATNYPSLLAPDNEASEDPDHDGATNMEEFAFAGDPTDANSQGLRRFAIETVGATRHLTVTAAMRAGAVFDGAGPLTESIDGIDYTARGSDNLTTFALGLTEVTPAIVTGLPLSAPAGFEYRTFRLTDTVEAHPKAFLQIKAAATP
jgi:autotransporter-associated beta strand protein